VGATQHQVLAIHGDNKVIVMLDERQQAAVRGVRRGELGAFFHGYGYDGAGMVSQAGFTIQGQTDSPQ
jgi:hypothetical protein